MNPARSRREELLAIAADLFAQRGFKNTTVRDIADAAGILSGSLYHHFDSKESMVDEILSSFQTELFKKYDEILGSGLDARAKVEAVVRVSFEAIDQHHAEVAIFQNDSSYLMEFERFGYLREHNTRFREMWLGLLRGGRRERRAAPGRRRRAGVPVHPRHGVGRRAVVPPRGRDVGRPGGRPVPLDPPRRHRRPPPPGPPLMAPPRLIESPTAD